MFLSIRHSQGLQICLEHPFLDSLTSNFHLCSPRLPRPHFHPSLVQASNVKIADFLQRNFRNEDHRNAAAKNAFALLGQHRSEAEI